MLSGGDSARSSASSRARRAATTSWSWQRSNRSPTPSPVEQSGRQAGVQSGDGVRQWPAGGDVRGESLGEGDARRPPRLPPHGVGAQADGHPADRPEAVLLVDHHLDGVQGPSRAPAQSGHARAPGERGAVRQQQPGALATELVGDLDPRGYVHASEEARLTHGPCR